MSQTAHKHIFSLNKHGRVAKKPPWDSRDTQPKTANIYFLAKRFNPGSDCDKLKRVLIRKYTVFRTLMFGISHFDFTGHLTQKIKSTFFAYNVTP